MWQVAKLVDEGVVRPRVHSVLDLEDAVRAHELVEVMATPRKARTRMHVARSSVQAGSGIQGKVVLRF